jgi:hypothetical protein
MYSTDLDFICDDLQEIIGKWSCTISNTSDKIHQIQPYIKKIKEMSQCIERLEEEHTEEAVVASINDLTDTLRVFMESFVAGKFRRDDVVI